MDTDTLQRHWEQAKARVRAKWDRLTDDDILFINGSSERLCKKLVSRYDYTHGQARVEAAALVLELERSGVGPDAAEAGGAQRESSVTNPGGVQAKHPPRGLDDALRDGLGGGSIAAGDF